MTIRSKLAILTCLLAALFCSGQGFGDTFSFKGRLLKEGSREPLAGAFLHLVDPRDTVLSAKGEALIASAQSDDAGTVIFPSVPAGFYRLRLDRNASGRKHDLGLFFFAPGYLYDQAEIPAPEVLAESQSGEGESIAGLGCDPCGRFQGLAKDTAGHPLGGIRIDVWKPLDSGQNGRGPLVCTTRTDEKGVFSCELAYVPGVYRLEALRPGYETSTIAARLYSTGPLGDPVSFVFAEPGRLTGRVIKSDRRPIPGVRIDLLDKAEVKASTYGSGRGFFSLDGIEPGEYALRLSKGDRQRTVADINVSQKSDQDLGLVLLDEIFALTGTVRDSLTGGPVSNARVVLLPSEPDKPGGAKGMEATCDEGGGFEFSSLPGDFYVMTVKARGFAEYNDYLDTDEWPGELLIELDPLGTVKGLVADDEGRPIENALLEAFNTDMGGMFKLDEIESAVTGPDGVFVVDELPPGVVLRMRASHVDYAFGLSEPLVLSGGEVRQGLTITLRAGGGVFGTVKGGNDEAVQDAQIELTGTDPGVSSVEAVTDASGSFRLQNLPEGVYDLGVVAEDYLPSKRAGIDVKAGELTGPLVERLTGTSAIKGRVRKADSGEPLPYVVVSASPETRDSIYTGDVTTSQKDGSFQLEGLNPGSRFAVVAKKKGFLIWSASGVVPDSQPMEILLEPGGAVEGIVLLPDGSPAHQFIVKALDQNNSPSPINDAAVNRESGQFRLTGLEPGIYSLTAQAEQFAPSTPRSVEIVGTGVIEGIALRLRKGANLEGKVISGAGAGVPGVNLMARPLSDEPSLSGVYLGAKSREDGSFNLKGLPEGTYLITARADGLPPVSRTIQVPLEGPLEIPMREGIDCSFSIIDAGSGKAMEGVSLVLSCLDAGSWGMEARCTSESDGACRVSGLSPGLYQLFLSSSGTRLREETMQIQRPESSQDCREVIEVEQGGSLVGRILAPASALDGVSVRIIHPSGVRSDQVSLDGSGNFTMYGLSPGLYRVFVHFESDMGQQISREVEITAGAVSRVSIELTGQGEVFGKVLLADGGPVTDVTVDLSPVSTLYISEGGEFSGGRTRAAHDGSYRFPGLMEGLYRITVMEDNPFAAGRTMLPYFESVDLRGRPGAISKDLILPDGTVQGAVVDATTGRGLSQASVTIDRLDGKPEFVPELGRARLLTENNGSFAFDAVPENGVKLTVVKDGYRSFSETIPPSRAPVTVHLKPTNSSSLRIIEAATGRPPDSVELLFLDGGGSPLKYANLSPGTHGEFTFEDPGASWLWVFGPSSAGVRVPVAAGSVELPLGGALVINVIKGDGAPCAGARVGLTGPQGVVWFTRGLVGPGNNSQVLTGADGSVRIEGLLEGRYVVTASGAEGLVGQAEAEVLPRKTETLTVVVSPSSAED